VTSLVEGALHATYQLSPTGSGRLRRLTAASGLSNENVLSRVALATSLADPAPISVEVSPVGGKGKEIKGTTLLGRPGPASLLVALIVRHHDEEVSAAELRTLIIGHWERGLQVINAAAGGGSVVDQIAERIRLQDASTPAVAGGRGAQTRDSVAASLGREFGRLPVEVRRLLALVGRFDLGRARAAATRLIDEVGTSGAATGRVSESQAMRVLTAWGLNRLGMTASDSATMERIHDAGDGLPVTTSERDSVEFLANLGLVDLMDGQGRELRAVPSTMAVALGAESWRQ